jgi:hypothetical protein
MENNNYLKPVGRFPVPMAVDNLEFDDETKSVIATGHPKTLHLIQWVKKRTGPRISSDLSLGYAQRRKAGHPPSMILQCSIESISIPDTSSKAQLPITCKTLYSNPGSEFGTSSTGIILRNPPTLVVSGLYDVGLLQCSI